MQDLDPDAASEQGSAIEVFESILTDRVRDCYEEIADLLIGQPGQTIETMSATCDGIIALKPTLVQLSTAYKPWVAKYQMRMLAEGPCPIFLRENSSGSDP